MLGRVLIVTLLAVSPLAAQGRGGGGGDVGGAPQVASNPVLKFIDELDLDRKTQVPQVEALLVEAEKESLPIAQELVLARQEMLNVATAGQAGKVTGPANAYAAAVAKMVALEARTFASVYALLKPNQKSRAPKAFDELAAILRVVSAPPSGGRRGGR